MEKVFHIISHFNLGGAEKVALSIVESGNPQIEYHVVELLRSRGEYSHVFRDELQKGDIMYHRFIVPDIQFHFLFERIAALLFPLWFIFLYLRYKPTVIHSHTEAPDIATWLFFKMFPFAKKHCKVVRTIHNTVLWTGQKAIGEKVERFFKECKSNIAISQAVQESYNKEYGELPPIIYNGIESAMPKSYDGIVEGKINVLFAGRFEPQKGIDKLVEVIASLKNDERYFFHIFGDGSLKELVFNRLQGQKNVAIKGPKYGLPSYLSSFDYLFMPSIFEGLGILSVESSLSGTPVIINDVAGLNETVPNDWQLKAPNGTLDEYVHIFNEVLSSVNRTEIVRQGREYVEKTFSIKVMRKLYEDIYCA